MMTDAERGAWLAALEADSAFHRELVRVYGPKRAGDMRYVPTSRHTDPALVSALERKLAADEAWRSL